MDGVSSTTQLATILEISSNTMHQWTMKRLALNLGASWDYHKSGVQAVLFQLHRLLAQTRCPSVNGRWRPWQSSG
jgi:hypothetical protein